MNRYKYKWHQLSQLPVQLRCPNPTLSTAMFMAFDTELLCPGFCLYTLVSCGNYQQPLPQNYHHKSQFTSTKPYKLHEMPNYRFLKYSSSFYYSQYFWAEPCTSIELAHGLAIDLVKTGHQCLLTPIVPCEQRPCPSANSRTWPQRRCQRTRSETVPIPPPHHCCSIGDSTGQWHYCRRKVSRMGSCFPVARCCRCDGRGR